MSKACCPSCFKSSDSLASCGVEKQLPVFLVGGGIIYISLHLLTLISSYQLENWMALFTGGQLVGDSSL